MHPHELLQHPRYGADPVFLFVELLAVDTIEGLSQDTADWIAQTIQTDVKNWRQKVKAIATLSETFEVAVLDLWYRNSRIAADRGELLTAADFAVMFVDKYYESGSQVDVWSPGALEDARLRIAVARRSESGNRQ